MPKPGRKPGPPVKPALMRHLRRRTLNNSMSKELAPHTYCRRCKTRLAEEGSGLCTGCYHLIKYAGMWAHPMDHAKHNPTNRQAIAITAFQYNGDLSDC